MKQFFKQIKFLQFAVIAVIALFTFSCEPESFEPDPPREAATTDGIVSKINGTAMAKGNTSLQNQINAQIRRATARYHNVANAEADGYTRVSGCVSTPSGGMGYHYLNNEYLLDGVIDPSKPELLVYEPMRNGKLKLGGVEFMVIAEQWDANNDGPPMLGNQEFDDHRPVGSGGPPFPHYQLHAWVWTHNPSGMYAPFNPKVSCEFAE